MTEHLTAPVWVELTQTEGDIVAELMVQHLRGAGIPAYQWQEGVGGALGLNVGPLGATHILVDESRYDEARALLELDEAYEDDLSGWRAGGDEAQPPAIADAADEKSADFFTRVSRAVLGFIAVIFSPFGVLFALLLKLLPRERALYLDDEEPVTWEDDA